MGGAQRDLNGDAEWPWIVRNPWLANAFRDRRGQDTRDFDNFACEVQSVIRDLSQISDTDIERVRERLERELGNNRAWSPSGTATMIGMAIGYVLAKR
jgi:ElaB/YqjD/DUF883 family membrane-anchored ribosome-binding protein